MATQEISRVGRRGAVVIPAPLRKRFGIKEGSYVVAEERDDGILLRPAVVVPYVQYTPVRVAEFLLGSAVDATSYREAVEEVRRMGLDPEKIDHFKPAEV